MTTARLGTQFNSVENLEATICPTCGIVFAVPDHWLETRRQDHKKFSCPNGHDGLNFGEGELERLQRQLQIERDATERLVKQRDAAYRRTSAQKGQVTKLKNRAKAGACPSCNRTFVQLQRHMASQHPDFKADE